MILSDLTTLVISYKAPHRVFVSILPCNLLSTCFQNPSICVLAFTREANFGNHTKLTGEIGLSCKLRFGFLCSKSFGTLRCAPKVQTSEQTRRSNRRCLAADAISLQSHHASMECVYLNSLRAAHTDKDQLDSGVKSPTKIESRRSYTQDR